VRVPAFIEWMYYRIRRPFWTWRPGRPWCSTCWRWTAEPHRHFTFALDSAAFTAALRRVQATLEGFAMRPRTGELARVFKAAADYERSMKEVRRYCEPTPKAAEAMRAAGILNQGGTAGKSPDRGT